MRGVVLNSELARDHLADPLAGPEVGGEPGGFGSCCKQLLELLELSLRQPWLASGASSTTERLGTTLFELRRPARDRLAVNAESSSNLGLRNTLRQQLCSFHSSSFQLFKVASNATCISHKNNIGRGSNFVTIICNTQ